MMRDGPRLFLVLAIVALLSFLMGSHAGRLEERRACAMRTGAAALPGMDLVRLEHLKRDSVLAGRIRGLEARMRRRQDLMRDAAIHFDTAGFRAMVDSMLAD